MGRLREQSPGALLHAHRGRTQATGARTRKIFPHDHGYSQGPRDGVGGIMNLNPGRNLRKILALAHRRRLDRELAEEMEMHRILIARDGGNPGPVMGNITLAREESRDMWTFRQLEWILQDARHALRGLRRSPAF